MNVHCSASFHCTHPPSRHTLPIPRRQALSLASCSKLINLLELFSSPRFVFARPGNAAFAAQLIESLNNVIQYQYETNAVLGEGRERRMGR